MPGINSARIPCFGFNRLQAQLTAGSRIAKLTMPGCFQSIFRLDDRQAEKPPNSLQVNWVKAAIDARKRAIPARRQDHRLDRRGIRTITVRPATKRAMARTFPE